ncbi:putative DNA mismatch repair protein MutS/MSH [Helianthus annuus]|nr:putative DNA mismatch repair protein MutS/MSH [Helianthus annuus]KAJ0597730.1 putative DNA mismatch repair protein MutS/MSH [Helianthus annuus]KAJ0758373.1 putative DNA mismatch repair protein MutS/MSH [Helianthus annuus]KAJ0762032.1 putative DNA mismatch repair protein MutS/MSH [Helianthus annuus]
MAFRRPANGRSPLVNPQRQITSFFSKSPSSTSSHPPSHSPSPISNSKPNPNPNPKPTTTPSPLQTKSANKLPLVIGNSPSTPASSASNPTYGDEVVNRRIRVYWPLDKCWYEGCVKSFDKSSGKHLVQYDDAEEERLDLSKEKIELLKEQVKKLKRLRRFSVEEDEDDEAAGGVESGGDDSADEDWGKSVEKEVVDDEMEDLGLVDEEEEEVVKEVKQDLKRRKVSRTKSDSVKKIKTESPKILSPKVNNNCGKATIIADNVPVGDVADRYAAREEEKFRFLGKNRKDANKRSPGDEKYDPRTLYLPPEFLRSLTGGQRQWWEFKSKHMDKVLFFKMGKFYELFEMDAHVGAKELDLQYMKGDQPHCGFPEKNYEVNAEKLARKGYRVLVVEQTETPDQAEKRRKQEGSKDKVVKREICAVITKGTLTDGEMLSTNPDASYLFAVAECYDENQQDDRIYGVCVVDIATSKIIIGQFSDDSECSVLSCLLSQLRPVEIIKPKKTLSPETERVLLRQTRSPVINELVPAEEFWDSEKTIQEIKKIYQRISNESQSDSKDYLPEILSELMTEGKIGSFALSALGGTLFYLKKAFLDESLLRFAKFELLPCSGFADVTTKPYMILDATALENLEVFENSVNGDSKGTLYDQLNRCVTPFGKRLLKAWLARPLYDINSIRERQEAVAGVKGANLPLALEFRKDLSLLPDMERLLARIFSCSEANGRNSSKVILYEDAARKQLQEFIIVLSGCDVIINACASLGAILENTDSKLLHRLLTPGKDHSDVNAALKHFKNAFDWMEAKSSGRIIPRDGVDNEYDSACRTVTDIEFSLKNHLKEQRKLLGDSSINYVTVGKDSYLLEVPESLSGCLPSDYERQSSKKGVARYWTPAIKKYIRELSEAESEKESKLKSIMQRLIGRFCEHHVSWRQLISKAAELDVLISIAIASDLYEGPTCRPLIVDSSVENESPFLVANSLGHPILRNDTLGDGTFVPNDVSIGGSNKARFILLTGPNMGGKSTLLRQVCLAVILAQVGADVPAESFKMSPVDRIFVRMGAKDHIMAGQSTFLTELLETASMLSSATHNSLVALDELGRGTATSDGQAIAASVLEHLVNKVQCRGLFSTHYHHLALDYQQIPKVSLCHMACKVGKELGGLEEVTFLYKLTPGACPKSYGVNVARLAGLPDDVLKKATIKSEEFETMYGNKRNQSNCTNMTPEITVFFQSLRNCLVDARCGSSPDDIYKLQHRAKTLLEQK